MGKQLIESFLNFIIIQRKGGQFDWSILKNFVKFLTSIEINYTETLYNQDLEPKIIENTNSYYNSLVQETLSKETYSFYLRWGLSVLNQEETNLSNFLPPTTVTSVIQQMKSLIFYQQYRTLLECNDGVLYLLKQNKLEELYQTFMIFSEDQNSHNLLLKLFKNYIQDEFEKLIKTYETQCSHSEDPREVINKTNYVEEFIVFYSTISKLIEKSFCNSNIFNVSFREVLENIQGSYIKFNNSYLLPFYIDKNFRRGSGLSNEDLNKLIEQLINIFPTLPDKDVFIDIHRNLLCNRLLQEEILSYDYEKVLVNKVKLICGVEFTSNIEGMFTDYQSGRELNTKYKTWERENKDNSNLIMPIETNVI
jgi:hypothetical protein